MKIVREKRNTGCYISHLCYVSYFDVVSVILFFYNHFIYLVSPILCVLAFLGSANHFISFLAISYILCQTFYFFIYFIYFVSQSLYVSQPFFSLLALSYILCQLCSIFP
jgi:hypothetical protein